MAPSLFLKSDSFRPSRSALVFAVLLPLGLAGCLGSKNLEVAVSDEDILYAAPVIDSISPSRAIVDGGTLITLTGKNFGRRLSVSVNGVPCQSYTYLNFNQATCRAPVLSAGVYDVALANHDGQEGVLPSSLEYLPPPIVTSVSPANGKLAGGDELTITGTGFRAGAIATVGGVECLSVTLVSDTEMRCNNPSRPAGTYDVAVTNEDLVTRKLANAYTYNPYPVIETRTPAIGRLTGRNSIRLTGSGFLPGATVTLGGSECVNPVVENSSTLTCFAPAHAAGLVDILVTNLDSQSGVMVEGYLYNPPLSVSGKSPASGAQVGGNVLTLNGTGFLPGAIVNIGGASCSSVTVVNSTKMTCVVPAKSAGTYDIVIDNPDEQTVTLSGAFGYTYNPFPTISAISPGSGYAVGGTYITLTGTGFFNGATASVGGSNCSSTIVMSSTSTVCVAPALPKGGHAVTIVNPDGQAAVLAASYTAVAAPVITSVSPAIGALAGGTVVTLAGSEFRNGATVTIGGQACTLVSFIDSQTLTCLAPAKSVGTWQIQVTNPDAQIATLDNAFTYSPFPTVTGVSPNNGKLAGGTTLTITGTGFIHGASVLVGAATCTSPTVLSSTSMTCVSPAQAAGVYAVQVTNPDTQFGTLNSAFTYNPLPTISSNTPTNGKLSGGTTLTITGTGFKAGATATVGGAVCASPNVVSATSMTCMLPARAAGVHSLVVTNPDSQTATSSSAYTYNPWPTIASISPSSGNMLGGSTVTVTGTGFVAGATVSIHGYVCSSVNVLSSTSLTCVRPALPVGSLYFYITNPDSQYVITYNIYNVSSIPLTSVSPNNGALAGGTLITISGAGFVDGASVTVGGVTCTSPTVVNSTTLTCVTSARAAGSANVMVVNGDTQTATLPSGYTYNAFPTVTGISPSNGLVSGGQTVTVSGTGFRAGATVTIGGTPCTSPNVVSSTSITCVNPAMSAGTYSVSVTNPDTQAGSLTNGFAYNSFYVLSVVPNQGKQAGGDALTITGTDFVSGATVTIGGASCTLPTVVDGNTITCYSPAKAAGPYDVVVTNGDSQTATLPVGYTFRPFPTISSLSPAYGKLVGGNSVTISGSGFLAGATVTFGGVSCTSPSVINATTLTCVAPAQVAGVYDVVVTNPDTQVVTRTGGYTYYPFPTVTAVSPTNGRLTGGTRLTITGTGFLSGTVVRVGGATCTGLTFTNSTTLSCNSPNRAAGLYDITVTNPDTQAGSLVGAYTYNPLPTLSSLSPTQGRLAGGTTITLTGTGFFTGATATVGGSVCSSPSVLNATTMSCVVPAKSTGTYHVIVTNPDTQTATLVSSYTYSPLPTITQVSPNFGKQAGGTAITVSGTGFISGATVTIGGVPCTGATVASSTSITCSTPAQSVGSYAVVVTNPDTQTGTLAAGFNYFAFPVISEVSPPIGTTQGGFTLTLTGTGFRSAASVTVGGNECTSVWIAGDGRTLTCWAPPGALGVGVTRVTNPDTQFGEASSFSYADITDPASSTVQVSSAIAPSDGLASVRVIVTPRLDPARLAGSAKEVEISAQPSGAVLTGGTACRTPSSDCLRATEIAPGAYAVAATSDVVEQITFSAVVVEEPEVQVAISQTATVDFDSSKFLLIDSATTITSSHVGQNLYFRGGISTFDPTTTGLNFGHLVVRNATLKHVPTTSSTVRKMDIAVSSLTLLTGGSIDVQGLGYLGGYAGLQGDSYGGPSSPSQALSSADAAGASHGGRGGYWSFGGPTDPGSSYGDYKDPQYPGGGAFGVGTTHAGGGVVRLRATQYCTLEAGAAIRADASPQYGGAGGSVALVCGGFTGSATAPAITANGGSAVQYIVSGGGGGRISLRSTGDATTFSGSFSYPHNAASLASFKQIVQNRGGREFDSEYPAGGAGTVFLQHSGVLYGDLIIDNEKTFSYPTDGVTEFMASTQNSSVIYSSANGTSAQVVSEGGPFSDQLNIFAGYWVQVFPFAASANPLHVSHTSVLLSGNSSDSLITVGSPSTGAFPDISNNYYYRFIHRLNHLDIGGYSQVALPGADLILEGCDLHSTAGTAFHVPTGSRITGNSLASGTCTQASLGTPGTTVLFEHYYLP